MPAISTEVEIELVNAIDDEEKEGEDQQANETRGPGSDAGAALMPASRHGAGPETGRGHGERVLVCVGSGYMSGRVVRAGKQLANSLQAEWVALYVETPEHYRLPPEERERIARSLRLVEELGGETAILPGQNVARETLRYARANGITKIVVGRVPRDRWVAIRGSLADELVRSSGNIDIFIVTTPAPRTLLPSAGGDARGRKIRGYLFSLLALAAATLIGLVARRWLDPTSIVLIVLLAVVLSATTWGLGPSILSSVVAVFLVDALFIPPYGFFSISGLGDLLALAVFLVIAFIISELGGRVRMQMEAAQQREQQIGALYGLTREVAFADDRGAIFEAASKQIGEVFDAETIMLLSGPEGNLEPEPLNRLGEIDRPAAEWSLQNGEPAGAGMSSFSDAAWIFLPLKTAQGTLGVLGVQGHGAEPVTPEHLRLLETFGGQIAIALEHVRLSAQAEQAQVLEASERFRNALLSSISHDLRTPLAAIMGSATSLLDPGARLGPDARQDLILTIKEEAAGLNRLVANLLNMTRVEGGALQPQCEWHSVEEVVGAALEHRGTEGHPIQLDLEPDLPLIPFDFVLIEQVLMNLLDNAYKFSPPGSPVEISARQEPPWLCIAVSDRGIGIPKEELLRVFDKFYRVPGNKVARGTGLGLSICKGIVEAHGGRIWAEQRDGGGARISMTLPMTLEKQA